MAVYAPANHIAAKALGNGSGNIGTWQVQNTLGAGDFHIHRTTTFQDPNGASVTIEVGATAATTTAQQIMNAQVLAAHVEFVQNWWIAVPNSSYFGGFANTATCNGHTSGYTYS
jgi:hypothetical protein